MRKTRKGFTLMEVVVAMLIAIMISTSVATLLSISFNILASNQRYRTQQMVVNGVYEFLSDEIKVANDITIVEGNENQTSQKGYKKAYTIGAISGKGRVLKVADIDENGVVGAYSEVYPESFYRKSSKENYNIEISTTVIALTETEKNDGQKSGTLKMEVSIFDKDELQYSKTSSIRVNLLANKNKDVTSSEELLNSKTGGLTIFIK